MENREKVLIIGINSFLGRAIYFKLVDRYSVTAVFNKNIELIPEGASLCHISELESIAFEPTYKYVFLVSSYIPETNHIDIEEKLFETNIKLPLLITKLFPNSKIVFCSSVSIYENVVDRLNINEDTPPSPKTPYGISKLWGEQIISLHKSYGILRISSMYGVGMKRNTFLPRIIDDALRCGEIKLSGDGSRLQNYVHVDDVAEYAMGAAKNDTNGIWLAVNNKGYSNYDIANVVSSITGCKILYQGTDNSWSFRYNAQNTLNRIVSEKSKDIQKGIEELIEWIAK